MFRQTRSVGFVGDANARSVNVLSSGHRQNENLMHRGNQLKPSMANNSKNSNRNMIGGKNPVKNMSMTPAGKKSSTTRRRAFGDISNKKANNGGFGQVSSTGKPNQKQNDIPKKRSVTVLPRVSRNAPSTQKTRFAVLTEQPKASRSKGGIQEAVSNRNRINHQSSLSRKAPLSVAETRAKSPSPLKSEPIPDIERPAGRTWKQQLEYDLKFEDDMSSDSSIENILSPVSRHTRSSHARREQERALDLACRTQKAEEEDRQVRERIQAMMDEEQKETEEGLNNLYDIMDNFEFFSEDNGNNSVNLLLEDDDDNWSIPDSSGFGLDLSDEDLLFSL